MDADVIIVGAGMAGLMAARELCRAGKSVIVLEARNRLGGRAYTLTGDSFPFTAEGGAEFIHGHLPITISLLEEAGISYHAVEGESWRYLGGKFKKVEEFIDNGELLSQKLKELTSDVSIADFLKQYFSEDQFAGLTASLKGFVEGYDAADINEASAFALRDEWSNEEQWEQYRIGGGYVKLVEFLEKECINRGGIIHMSTLVKNIDWQQEAVKISSATQASYTAARVIVTVPMGVLRADASATAAITFLPALPEKFNAARLLGYGAVIKILLQFKEAFWKTVVVPEKTGAGLENMGWIFSDQPIPTWWTQLPEDSCLLTGWLAGPNAFRLKDAADDTIIDQALYSLSTIFRLDRSQLKEQLALTKVINWAADPYSLGAYSFSTTATFKALKEVSAPVSNTLFFAGEALQPAPGMGTVEGALASGLRVAKEVLSAE